MNLVGGRRGGGEAGAPMRGVKDRSGAGQA